MKRVTRIVTHGAWTYVLFALTVQAIIQGDTVWAIVGLVILGGNLQARWQEGKSLRKQMATAVEALESVRVVLKL